MPKKLIIDEGMMKRIIANELLSEATNNNDDLDKKIKAIARDVINNDKQVDKDLEKKVKKIVASAVNTLFKTLWQRRNFYEDEIKR